jgi:RsiW-degrading membrane proteinase PrsW (M82 family)
MIEELAKYTVAVFTVINTKHFHKMSDAITYMILIGLGFSLVEDAIFFLNPATDAPYRLLSFYVHSGTSAIIGYSLGRFKFGQAGYGELFRAVCGAILLHFGYNLATSLSGSETAFWLTVAITIYISLQIFILFRRAQVEEYEIERQDTLGGVVPSKLLNLTVKSKQK